jgi:hypothetical protein
MVPIPECKRITCDVQGEKTQFLLKAYVGCIGWAVHGPGCDRHLPRVQLLPELRIWSAPHLRCVGYHWLYHCGQGELPDVHRQAHIGQNLVVGGCHRLGTLEPLCEVVLPGVCGIEPNPQVHIRLYLWDGYIPPTVHVGAVGCVSCRILQPYISGSFTGPCPLQVRTCMPGLQFTHNAG